MGLVQRRTGSGLVLAEQAQDEAAVTRALKQIDRRLFLWPPDGLSPYYRVVESRGDDREAEIICTWMDDATLAPLPLSSGLIDRVDRLRLDARNKGIDADAFNALRSERIQAEQQEIALEIASDHRAKVERQRVTVSLGANTSLPYYQRNHHLPERMRR